MRAVLDTSVVIATDVAPLPGELAISAVTLAELHFGVLVAKDLMIRAERLRRLSILQRRFDALPLNDALAASCGQVAAAVVEAGRQPRARSMDLLIAATAHAHAARLYTSNPTTSWALTASSRSFPFSQRQETTAVNIRGLVITAALIVY